MSKNGSAVAVTVAGVDQMSGGRVELGLGAITIVLPVLRQQDQGSGIGGLSRKDQV